ncbi:hypothetical protein LXT21_44235 [Myxococcus sp. K38C18041901]|uniref:hypothetical protein n=1 Tax=Myxococcus guangdongensis TaxID=2906760 RepID=UPI0020A6FFEE|nr:hypothetical protein [Myxococcus guangdongensis]MCP3065799.1 hypothetical protein [Myxococcus guangdongensis]
MAGNRLTVEVALVGPRAGETCSLAGFDFNAGVAEVPRHAATALHILGKYHNAFPKDSREHEEAERQWTKSLATAGEKAAGAAEAKLVSALDDARAHIDSQGAELERLRAELRAAREVPGEPVMGAPVSFDQLPSGVMRTDGEGDSGPTKAKAKGAKAKAE